MEKESVIMLRVRYQETDQMGVVHHANYINWFEIGRTEWLRRLGTTYRQIEEKGILLPVIQVHCEYKHPARYDDLVQIRARLAQYSGVRLTFAYEVYRENELLATGSTSHCWTNRELRPIPLKKNWPELHQLLEERFGQTTDERGDE